jgi:hypothetical protein
MLLQCYSMQNLAEQANLTQARIRCGIIESIRKAKPSQNQRQESPSTERPKCGPMTSAGHQTGAIQQVLGAVVKPQRYTIAWARRNRSTLDDSSQLKVPGQKATATSELNKQALQPGHSLHKLN